MASAERDILLSLSFQVVSAQALITLAAVVSFALFWSSGQAAAAALGGLSVAAPAAYFAWRADRERSPQKLLGLGVGKFVSTCALLAGAVVLFKPPPAGLFVTLFACQLAYIVVPLMADKSVSRVRG